MKWAVAYLSGISSSVLTAVILAAFLGGLNKLVSFSSILAGLICAVFIIIKYPKLSGDLAKKDFGFWSYATIIFFIIFSLRSFLWLIFKKGDTIQVLNPHNFGDIALHITYIKYLANGVSFWPDNPILAGEKIHYPIGIDLFNSLLILCGMDLIQSLVWASLLSSACTLMALLIWGRAFTLAGFLFNGGIAVAYLFFKTHQFVDHNWEIAWKSIPLTLFVTQRGFLYAIPAGLLLLSGWRKRFFNNESAKGNILPFWVEVLLYSTMPIFHMHTFIYLSFLLCFWIIFANDNVRHQVLSLIKSSLVPAMFFIACMTGFFKGFSIVHLHPGWEQNNQNFFYFWLWNFGIFLPLAILLCLKLVAGKEKILNRNTAFVYPAVLIFILCCFVMFHPNNWDNIKLFMWSYLILLPFIWENLISKWDMLVKYAVCFLLFVSGFISIVEAIDSKHRGNELFKLSEVREVEHAVKYIPIKYRFASYPTFNHPLLYSGRKVVMGYAGHLWVHGFSYGEVEQKLKRLMLGDPDWQKLARELDVRYIFWGEREKHEYATSSKPWETSATKIASGGWGEIWDLGLN